MALGQTTRTASNSTDMHNIKVLVSLDSGTTFFNLTSWFSSLNASGGEANTSEFKYFGGDPETAIDSPGNESYELIGRYSEGATEPYLNLRSHFRDGTNDRKVTVRYFNVNAEAGDKGWQIQDGILTFVSGIQNMDANNSQPNTFTWRVSGLANEYDVVAGDLLTPPSYS